MPRPIDTVVLTRTFDNYTTQIHCDTKTVFVCGFHTRNNPICEAYYNMYPLIRSRHTYTHTHTCPVYIFIRISQTH